jgi:hypothetical protein
VIARRKALEEIMTLCALRFVLVVASVGTAAVAMAQPSGSFSRTADMTAARSQHSATLLPDGRVLIAGGMSSTSLRSSSVLASAEFYDPLPLSS